MNYNNCVHLLACVGATLFLASAVVQASDEANALGSQVFELANQGDFRAIEKIIDAQENQWKSSPNISYFDNIKAISLALVMTGTSNDRRYWLFRTVAWDALLKPAPPVPASMDSSELWRSDNCKEDIIFAAKGAIPYVVQASPDMYVSIRHDTALMLIEYARQIHAQLIPNYHNKPVAAGNDPDGGPRLRQNAIDNSVQNELQSASHRLASRKYVYDLITAYSHPPRDDEELKEVIDALGIHGTDLQEIIRRVTGGKGFSASGHVSQ